MNTTQFVVTLCWLVVTGVGLALTITMMALVRSDLALIRARGTDGVLLALTKLSFWQEFRRFFVKLFFFSLGVDRLLVPPTASEHAPVGQDWLFIALLFGVVILLNYSTFRALQFRHRFLEGRIVEP